MTPPAVPAPQPVAVAPAPEPAKPAPAPKLSMAEMQKEVLKKYMDAFNASDAKAIAGMYSQDAMLVQSGMPEAKGKEAIESSTKAFMDGFPKSKIAATRFFQKGDMAVCEWAWNGTHAGEFMGMAPTNKNVGYTGVGIFWFDQDGQIKKEHRYFDVATLMGQLGMSKEKVRAIPTLATTVDFVTAKGTPDEDKNAETLKNMMGAFEKKSETDFLASLTDGIEYDAQAEPASHKGKAEAKKAFSMMTKAFPDQKISYDTMMGVGDFAIMESTMTGTHKGALGPIPATKKTVSLKGVDICQFKDAKIDHCWNYSNNMEFLTQLGLVKAPGAAKTDKTDKADKAAAKATTPAKADKAEKAAAPAKAPTPAKK
ncbi:MAG: SgcJ/EcaC family oxidoreductase [Polyangiaceae bacterium]